MGNYVVTVKAVGGHGCRREVKDGEVNPGCGQKNCPDCLAREFVAKLSSTGNSVSEATLTHWPDGPKTIVDCLKSGVRRGNF